MGEIRALTSLRGLGAILVFLYHLRIIAPSIVPNLFGIVGHGYLGVDFFFILSGFVLGRAYGERFTQPFDALAYIRFLIARVGRIFPLHIMVTALCVVVDWAVGQPHSPLQVLTESSLIHRWGFVHANFNAINGPAWSISTEWAAYLLFPVFAYLALGSCRGFAVGLGLGCLSVLCLMASRNGGSLDLALANTYQPLIRCFCEFGIGMLLWRMRGLRLNADLLVAAAITTLIVTAIARLPDEFCIVPLAMIILGYGLNRTRMAPELGGRVLYWLGEISFSVYLVHLPLILAVRWFGLPKIEFVAAVLILVPVVAWLSYRFIEVDWRERSKAWAQSMRVPAPL